MGCEAERKVGDNRIFLPPKIQIIFLKINIEGIHFSKDASRFVTLPAADRPGDRDRDQKNTFGVVLVVTGG